MKIRRTGCRILGEALSLLALAPLLSGCATMIHGTRQGALRQPAGAGASLARRPVGRPGAQQIAVGSQLFRRAGCRRRTGVVRTYKTHFFV